MADTTSGARPVPEQPSSRIDPSVPHPARRYDYWLGGKDNFAADRRSGDAVAEAYPAIRTTVIENRRFMHRATRYLAETAGIRQFLDIGTGIPTSPNMHEVAQAVAPESRVVYVDNDPIVLAHARALLSSAPEGATAAPVTTTSMIDMTFRSRDEFGGFFDGLDFVEPGISPVTEWRPDDAPEQRRPAAQASMYAAVARKS